MQPIIHVEKLIKQYRKTEKPAVNKITFDVQPGEFFAFLGPNGAGKTTTISILTTTLAKTGGNITIAGYDINSQAKDVRQNVGIIFQSSFCTLTIALVFGLGTVFALIFKKVRHVFLPTLKDCSVREARKRVSPYF